MISFDPETGDRAFDITSGHFEQIQSFDYDEVDRLTAGVRGLGVFDLG